MQLAATRRLTLTLTLTLAVADHLAVPGPVHTRGTHVKNSDEIRVCLLCGWSTFATRSRIK